MLLISQWEPESSIATIQEVASRMGVLASAIKSKFRLEMLTVAAYCLIYVLRRIAALELNPAPSHRYKRGTQIVPRAYSNC